MPRGIAPVSIWGGPAAGIMVGNPCGTAGKHIGVGNPGGSTGERTGCRSLAGGEYFAIGGNPPGKNDREMAAGTVAYIQPNPHPLQSQQ